MLFTGRTHDYGAAGPLSRHSRRDSLQAQRKVQFKSIAANIRPNEESCPHCRTVLPSSFCISMSETSVVKQSEATFPSWEIRDRTLRPSPTYIDKFCQSYLSHDTTDDIIRIIFAAHFGAPDEVVHHSRLSFVGGPLAVLVSRDFREKRDNVVTLSDADNPATFAAIRLFLYCRPIPLENLKMSETLDLARAAHRWQLNPLFQSVCRYMVEMGLLLGPQAVMQASDVAAFPDVPEVFSHCFWGAAATCFDAFGPEKLDRSGGDGYRLVIDDSDEDDGEAETSGLETPAILARLCPRFPYLWDIALSQGVVPRFLLAVKASSTRVLTADLLDLVLQYLEPKIPDDETVVRLIAGLDPGAAHCESLFCRPDIENDCSTRAIRLLGKSMLSATHLKHEMSFSWKIPSMASGMVKKTFLFGACSDTSDVNVSSHVSIEDQKHLYSTETCVLFSLQALVTGGSPSLFHVQWEVGQSFPLIDKDMDLRVAVVDSTCSCWHAQGPPDPEIEKCLYDWRRSAKVRQTERQISVVLPKAAFKILRERHNFSNSCPVMIWLHVRLR